MSKKQIKRQLNNESKLQLQQKIIHYRSELSIYENKMRHTERELKKEKTRTNYLQEKLYHAQNVNIEEYVKKIVRLENELLQYEVALEEEKKKVDSLYKEFQNNFENKSNDDQITTNESSTEIQSYFNYSLILPDEADEEKEIAIMGNFVIQNKGTEPLHDLIICIRLRPKKIGRLSGKIATHSVRAESNPLFESSVAEEWEFLHENWKDKIKKDGEYWMKPVEFTELSPGELIHFSNFELRLTEPEEKNGGVIEGFTYCKELPKGTLALNNIVINF